MESFFEGRESDSPYIQMVWRGRTGSNYFPVCPADVNWNLLFASYQGKVKVTIEGPLTQATPKSQPEGMEWLVIKFKLGAFIPRFPVNHLLDGDALLPEASSQTFWLNSSSWQLPCYENAEVFVEHLVKEEILVFDPIVSAVQAEQLPYVSDRTVRRRFLQSTGLTPKTIEQIERAHQSMTLLETGKSILDVVFEMGYADQPHLTRSLKRFIGITPAQITR